MVFEVNEKVVGFHLIYYSLTKKSERKRRKKNQFPIYSGILHYLSRCSIFVHYDNRIFTLSNIQSHFVISNWMGLF